MQYTWHFIPYKTTFQVHCRIIRIMYDFIRVSTLCWYFYCLGIFGTDNTKRVNVLVIVFTDLIFRVFFFFLHLFSLGSLTSYFRCPRCVKRIYTVHVLRTIRIRVIIYEVSSFTRKTLFIANAHRGVATYGGAEEKSLLDSSR